MLTELTNKLDNDLLDNQLDDMYAAAEKVMFRLRQSETANYINHKSVSVQRSYQYGQFPALQVAFTGLLIVVAGLIMMI